MTSENDPTESGPQGSKTASTGGREAPLSPWLFAVLCAAAGAGGAYLWLQHPEHRQAVAPLLGAAAILFALVAAWAFGRARRPVSSSDRRVDGFEMTSAAVLIADGDGRTRHMNVAAKKLLSELGVASGNGSELAALGLGADPDKDAGFVRLAGKVIRWRTRRMPRRDGRVWQFDDVTEIVRGHAELQRETSVLQDIFDLMPLGFLSADGDGIIDRSNIMLASWLGVSPEDLIGRSLGDFVIDGYDSGEIGGVSMGVVTLQPEDEGEAFLATLMQTARTDPDGNPLYTRSLLIRDVALDLTEGATVPEDGDDEDQFDVVAGDSGDDADIAARLRWLFQEAPIGIAFLDLNGVVTARNAALQRLLASKEEDLVGRTLVDLIRREDRDDIQGALSKVVMGIGHGAQLEAGIERADGRELSVNMTAARVTDSAGETSGLVIHFVDTTEHRNLEVQFTQSQKMQAVGQLAGGVAHDFNNLLTAMIGFSDLLLTRHGPDDPDFADIMQIKQNANRAAGLVRQLLAFSRQQTLQPRVLSMTDVLGDLSNLLRRLIGANIKLNMIHGRDLGLVRADQGQVEQVIINLAVNARDAMSEGGELSIETLNETLVSNRRHGGEPVPPGDYVVVKVSDSGIGIPKENLEHIFEPFFTTKEVGAGTGLGLSTVYGIVKQTGGYVLVDSVPGQGTTFTIMLPSHAAEAGAVRKVEATDAPEASETIGAGTVLVVEDEDAVRLFSARALRAKGYKVLEARTGEAAMELMGVIEEPIDLLITDAVMPEMDGPTLIKNVRDATPEMPVICISGYAEETFRKRLGEDTDIHFLPKPFSLAQLAGKVKEVLDRVAH